MREQGREQWEMKAGVPRRREAPHHRNPPLLGSDRFLSQFPFPFQHELERWEQAVGLLVVVPPVEGQTAEER